MQVKHDMESLSLPLTNRYLFWEIVRSLMLLQVGMILNKENAGLHNLVCGSR